jgi:hypothetical protein
MFFLMCRHERRRGVFPDQRGNLKMLQKTIFSVPKMDCPAEETIIRLRLEGGGIVRRLDFDIERRSLTVYHVGGTDVIEKALKELKLGAERLHTIDVPREDTPEFTIQRKTLRIVLVINATFFLLELAAGLISGSMGLVADSLDMLADAFVYAISLYAVGGPVVRKKKVARAAGYFQAGLALLGFMEVTRRFLVAGRMPDVATMIVVSGFALFANVYCLYLLWKTGSREAHMRASLIFTSNDVVINLGVIFAGLLVFWLDSGIPDLVIGGIVFVIVIRGAMKILEIGKIGRH